MGEERPQSSIDGGDVAEEDADEQESASKVHGHNLTRPIRPRKPGSPLIG